MADDDRPHMKDILAEVRSNRGWLVALGVLILVCGLLILGNLVAATIFSMVFVGVLVIFGGVFRFLLASRARNWSRFFYWALAGLLYVAAGIVAIMDPLAASVVFTFCVAALLVFAGGIRFWLGFEMRPGANWAWVAVSGLITLLAGLVFALGWPANSAWLIGMMLAVELIIDGVGCIMLGLALRARS